MGASQNHSDAELVRGWQRGDPRAFEVLVRRWQQPVARFLTRLVGRCELVQDLSQEVFLRVYLAGSRYRENGTFSTWLYGIALNVARDSGRRRRDPLPLLNHQPLAKADSPEATCERVELALAVAQALRELPDALREVLVLRHYEDMNFEEMARLLGKPASTLKSRFATALGRLRERLRQNGWTSGETEP